MDNDIYGISPIMRMGNGLKGEVYGEPYQSQMNGDPYFQFMPRYFSNIPIEMETDDACKKTIRTENLTPEEDLVLVSAWLNTSIDPIHGIDQKNCQFWRKIGVYFKEAIDSKKYGPRTDKSLTNRWRTIQQAVNKFCSYYTQREGSLHKSGDTCIDLIQDVKLIYHDMQKTPFRFENCWNKLRHNAMWINHMSQEPTKRKAPSGDTIHLDDEETIGGDLIDLERPMGQKKAKEAKKGKGKSGDTSQFDIANIKWTEEKLKNVGIKVEIAKEHLEMQKAKIDADMMNTQADQERADIAIMMIDVNKMENVVQREYFSGLQSDILARRRSD